MVEREHPTFSNTGLSHGNDLSRTSPFKERPPRARCSDRLLPRLPQSTQLSQFFSGLNQDLVADASRWRESGKLQASLQLSESSRRWSNCVAVIFQTPVMRDGTDSQCRIQSWHLSSNACPIFNFYRQKLDPREETKGHEKVSAGVL